MKKITVELTEKEANITTQSLEWNYFISGQNADTYGKTKASHDGLKEGCIDQMRTCEDVIKKIEKALKN